MTTKEEFLNKLAAKMGRERVQSVSKPRWLRHPWDHLHQDLDQAGLVDQWEAELTKLGGDVIRVDSEEALAGAIEAFLRERGMNRLIAWPSSAGEGKAPTGARRPGGSSDADPAASAGTVLPGIHGVDPAQVLKERGFDVTMWSSGGSREALILEAEESQAGLVYASHGISETGSIVLYNRGDRGRLVSLLPNQFLAVLRASDVVPRITQVLAAAGPQALDFSCMNIITGPSRTSDIEMDLTIGVHGPGRIAVFLIDDGV